MMDSIPALIEKTFPMPGRFRSSLPAQVAELSRLLTAGRGDRALSYLSRPHFLAAYLRYFLPWNLCRLCLLLPELELGLSDGDTITDLGCGTLTLVSALWISRPELRDLALEFRCIDRCAPALEAGKKFFTALAGNSPWKIHLIREDINVRRKNDTNRKEKPSTLVCAVNMLNEVYDNAPHNNTKEMERMAANIARIMHGHAAASASILIVEPGVPRSGQFISMLRSAFCEMGRPPIAPCTHTAACPFPGGKKRWCHFAYETSNLWFGDVPKELHRLSAAAGLPKERLVLSYLLAGPAMTDNAVQTGQKRARTSQAVRVISDAFPLPNNRFGRYCCSQQGLILLTGERNSIEKTVSGSVVIPVFAEKAQRDAKSGALIAEVKK